MYEEYRKGTPGIRRGHNLNKWEVEVRQFEKSGV